MTSVTLPGTTSPLPSIVIDGAAILNTVLPIVGMFYPPAAPFIAIAKVAIPALIAASPFIEAGIKNGISAVEAANNASPGLGQQLKALAGAAPGAPPPSSPEAAAHVENLTRSLVGLPHMTFEEERRWMDQTTGGGDPNVGMGG